MKQCIFFCVIISNLWVSYAQPTTTLVSQDTLNLIEKQSMKVLPTEEKLPEVKKEAKGALEFLDDANAQYYDNKWLEELTDKFGFFSLQNDIHHEYSQDVVYDELPTELLKSRLEKLNEKTPFYVEYNPILERVIKTFLKNRRSSLQRLMNISQYYFPMFEQTLYKHKIPLEIKYLAIVESALNPTAKSPAGAKGLWQFMYYTGKMYGLEVSNYVDERSDPERSTEAAATFLKSLYETFGDWDLALAAYNSGPGNVTKAMRRSGGKKNYWNLRPYLPRETAGYVPAFLATMYIFEYAKEHGFYLQKPERLFFETDTIRVKQHLPLDDVAMMVGVDRAELNFLNPSYRLGIVPYVKGKDYAIRLPINAVGKFVNNEDIIYDYLRAKEAQREKPMPQLVKSSPSGVGGRVYKVKQGDTLSKIAKMHGTTVDKLKRWNNLRSSNLKIGQRLVVRP